MKKIEQLGKQSRIEQRYRDTQDTEETQETQETESTEIPRDRESQETHDTHEAFRSGNVFTIQQAVKLSLEDGVGKNSIFVFARAIKAFEKAARKSVANELESIFASWWQKAKPYLGDSPDFDYTLDLFRITYEQTRVPLGKNAVDEAISLSKENVPEIATSFSSEAYVRLVAVCFHLQKLSGDIPFFLSVRDARRIANVDSIATSSVMMRGLVRRGILTVIEQGQKSGHRATRYRFNEKAKP